MNPLSSFAGTDTVNALLEQAKARSNQSPSYQQAMRQFMLNMWLPRNGVSEGQAVPSTGLLGVPAVNYPYTQISPKMGSHSNMPTVSPEMTMGANRPPGPVSYDELGRRYSGLTPDEARANYVTPPGAYVSYNQAYPMPPLAPQPGQQQAAPNQSYLQWLLSFAR